jgi:hypothetical protein
MIESSCQITISRGRPHSTRRFHANADEFTGPWIPYSKNRGFTTVERRLRLRTDAAKDSALLAVACIWFSKNLDDDCDLVV